MENNSIDITNIPQDKFSFVNTGERISDKKFEDKPISYLKDAWIRFRKNKASVVATVIIVIIVLFAFLAPVFTSKYDAHFMDAFYAKKGPRNETLAKIGIATGTQTRDFSDKGLIKALAVGMGAEDYNADGSVTVAQSLESRYQPIRGTISDPVITIDAAKKEKAIYTANIDTYLEVGFMYKSVEQAEYQRIVDWQNETGIQVLYPLIEDNEWCFDDMDANYWFKTNAKGAAVKLNKNGKGKEIAFSEDMTLEDNYMRDADGNPVYFAYTGGGSFETAQFKIRVLYYNYYIYLNGFAPEYIFGTDSQGYDLALRMADGIRLSLLLAVCVSVINFTLGAMYGAVEGYYGGAVDMVLERVSDILAGVPFVIVATLFQLHLAAKVGPVVCLIFAFIVTGWIGTASRVRTQFYRFKNQEYVMAARTLGARDARIIWKHIFPNSLGTIVTSAALVIPGVILSESTLSYLGIVKLSTAETTSLGCLLSDAQGIWTNYPHLMFFPALIISLLMICFNLFGNGLRDAFNPSLRGVED